MCLGMHLVHPKIIGKNLKLIDTKQIQTTANPGGWIEQGRHSLGNRTA